MIDYALAAADTSVQLTVPKPPARRRWRIWGVQSAGRFDRSVVSWRRSLVRLVGLGVWVTGTEAAGRTASEFRAALTRVGWDFVHLSGAAVGECYATWDAAVVELAGHPFARKLTDLTWVRDAEYGGDTAALVHALVVPLRNRRGRARVRVLVVVHMPLDNTAPRQAAWLDCCRGLRILEADLDRMYPGAEVVIVMDGNKNLHEPAELAEVSAHLEKPLRMVVSWRRPYPVAGTHARQLIDYALAAAGVIVACQLVADDDSSDHRPFRYRLRGWLRRVLSSAQG